MSVTQAEIIAFRTSITARRFPALREMRDDGDVGQQRRRRFGRPGTLPSVVVVEVTGVDIDGEVMARPLKWEDKGPPPKIYVIPETSSGPAPGVGERALARLHAEAHV